MFDNLDPVILARAQFAFTVSFHFIFPAFSIGLASYLMVLEGLWLRTGEGVYANLYRYWLKIFAVTFGMGVVSGVVLFAYVASHLGNLQLVGVLQQGRPDRRPADGL